MNEQKALFITKLDDTIAERNETHWDHVLMAAFAYFRNCNQLGIEPLSLFTPEEKSKTEEQIMDGMPLLKRDLQKRVNILGFESAQYLRQLRSGFEFIKENFTPNNAVLQEKFEEFMNGIRMISFNKKLEAFVDDRGEYDNGNNPVDLRGVPENHNWWCYLEREDSVRVFGRE